MANILIAVVSVYVAMVAALYVFQRSLLYHPARTAPVQSQSGVPEMTTHRVTTEDGVELALWYASGEPTRPVLVYFHGNMGHRGDRGFKVRPFLDAGYSVLLAEYRGFGGNPGSPSEQGLYQDGRAVLDFVRAQGIPARRIALYGESLGTGIAVQLALESAEAGAPLGAVVLEAPFASIPAVAATHYPYVPVRYLVRDRFDNLAKIASVGAPLLIVHGELDRTVPARFGRQLFDAATDPKEAHWIPNARHNDLADFGLFQRVDEFLSEHIKARPWLS